MGCGECCGVIILKLLKFLLGLIEIACAVAIIIIVAVQLSDVNISKLDPSNITLNETKVTCAMGNVDNQVLDDSFANLCDYAYAVSGVSMAATLILAIFLCITCDMCGGGIVIELIIAALLCVWWIVAACIFSKAAKDTNDIGDWSHGIWDNVTGSSDWSLSGMTSNDWRNAVAVLSWIAAVCFFIVAIVASIVMCCKCCDGGGRGSSSEDKREAKQAAKEAKEAAAEAKRSAAIGVSAGKGGHTATAV